LRRGVGTSWWFEEHAEAGISRFYCLQGRDVAPLVARLHLTVGVEHALMFLAEMRDNGRGSASHLNATTILTLSSSSHRTADTGFGVVKVEAG
jgi:hypothetical protein